MPRAATAHQMGSDDEARDLLDHEPVELVKKRLVEFNWPDLSCVED
jgi:hypothetical protein